MWVKLGKKTKPTHMALWRFLITPTLILSLVGVTIIVAVDVTMPNAGATSGVAWEGQTCADIREIDRISKEWTGSLVICMPVDPQEPPGLVVDFTPKHLLIRSELGLTRTYPMSSCRLYSLSACINTN